MAHQGINDYDPRFLADGLRFYSQYFNDAEKEQAKNLIDALGRGDITDKQRIHALAFFDMGFRRNRSDLDHWFLEILADLEKGNWLNDDERLALREWEEKYRKCGVFTKRERADVLRVKREGLLRQAKNTWAREEYEEQAKRQERPTTTLDKFEVEFGSEGNVNKKA